MRDEFSEKGIFSSSNSEEGPIRYVRCNDRYHKACAGICDEDDVGSVDCFGNCFKIHILDDYVSVVQMFLFFKIRYFIQLVG
jgi:hypothetical protein